MRRQVVRTGIVSSAFATVLLLSALASAQQREPTLVFRNVDVFDGSRMTRGSTVLVRDGMIRAVGPDLVIPESAHVIDGKGKTLLPGFYDAHTHLGLTQGQKFLEDALGFGVTTELEMWGSGASLALRRKMPAGAYTDIADFRTACTGVTVPRGHPTQMGGPSIPTLSPNDDVQAFVDARIAEGADYIKIMYDHFLATLTKQQIEDIVVAAHRRNKLVIAHIGTQSEAHDAVAAGVDGLAHIFAESPPEPRCAEFAMQHHVFVIPTLGIFEAIESATATSGKPWWRDQPHLGSYVTSSMRQTLEAKFPPGFGAKLRLANAKAAVRALHHAGVHILAGTDAPAPGMAHGLSLHRELELLVLSGLTPLEALASATSEPALIFGFHDRGRIAPGLRADLLLVNGNPSTDVTATRDIAGVWKLGVAIRRPRDP